MAWSDSVAHARYSFSFELSRLVAPAGEKFVRSLLGMVSVVKGPWFCMVTSWMNWGLSLEARTSSTRWYVARSLT